MGKSVSPCFAVLIPMLRVRHEQTAATLHADVPLRTIMNNHFTSKVGPCRVKPAEPQV
jgi:hypothetical protein